MNREDFLKHAGPKRGKIQLTDDHAVDVRGFTAKEATEYLTRGAEEGAGPAADTRTLEAADDREALVGTFRSNVALLAWVAGTCLLDDAGAPLFPDGGAEELVNLPPGRLRDIQDKVLELSGMESPDDLEPEKNS